MIRIAHLITHLTTGGAERMLERVVLGTDRGRFESLVISMVGEGTVGPRLREAGFELVSLGMTRGIPDPRVLPRLVGTLRRFRPDVLQTWLYHADLLGLTAGKLARVPRLYWNVRCADVDLASYGRSLAMLRAALARASKLPDAVVVNSEHGRRFHASIGYRPRRWETIPNGFDTQTFRPRPELRTTMRAQLGLAENAHVVGLVARYDAMKDHPNFLQAARIVATRDPLARFVLAGRGVDEDNLELGRLIRALELGSRCKLLGERRDIPELHAAFDVAALSSRSEGFPNSVGEAMACGVPCVATDVGDSSELIGDTGTVVPPRAPEALGEALTTFLNLPRERLATLAEAARERISARFGLPAVIRRYEALYSFTPTAHQ